MGPEEEETKGALGPANMMIHRGLRSEPSLEERGNDLAVDVEERRVLPQSSSRIYGW